MEVLSCLLAHPFPGPFLPVGLVGTALCMCGRLPCMPGVCCCGLTMGTHRCCGCQHNKELKQYQDNG